jgi:hypothetical protein
MPVWIGGGKYVRMQHFLRKGVEIFSEHRPTRKTVGWHPAESTPQPLSSDYRRGPFA